MRFRTRQIDNGLFVAEYQRTMLQKWQSCFTSTFSIDNEWIHSPREYSSEVEAKDALRLYCAKNNITTKKQLTTREYFLDELI